MLRKGNHQEIIQHIHHLSSPFRPINYTIYGITQTCYIGTQGIPKCLIGQRLRCLIFSVWSRCHELRPSGRRHQWYSASTGDAGLLMQFKNAHWCSQLPPHSFYFYLIAFSPGHFSTSPNMLSHPPQTAFIGTCFVFGAPRHSSSCPKITRKINLQNAINLL